MNRLLITSLPLLACAATLLLSVGCSSPNPESEIAASPPKLPAPRPITHAPIDPSALSYRLEVTTPGQYDAVSDRLTFTVRMVNTGTALLFHDGVQPVTLGVFQIGEGNPPKRGAETRAPLPSDLPPGGTILVNISIPAEFAVGSKVRIEPLQEGVAWFGYNYTLPVVDIAPLQRCGTEKASLCNGNGDALPSSRP